MKTVIIVFFIILLTACSNDHAPTQQWPMTVQGVYSACLSNDGKHAFIGSIHHGGSYWQVNPSERLFNWNHQAQTQTGILSCALSENGQFASTAEHRKIALWNTQTGEAVWLWEAPANIKRMSLSHNGNVALLGLDNYEAVLFDIQNGGVKQRLAHSGIVQAVSISGNGQWAMSGGDDSTVKVWPLHQGNNGKAIYSWQLNNQIKVVSLSHDGRLGFAASHRSDSILWNLENGEQRATFAQQSGHYQSARFNYDASQLLTGSSSGQVILWDVARAEKIKSWRLGSNTAWVNKNTQVMDVAFAEEGYKAVGADGTIYQLP